MLSPESWTHKATSLLPGQRVRTNHDCGAGRTLLISHTEQGLRAWCFRCNDGGAKPLPPVSTAERLARIREARAADQAVPALPTALPLPKTPWKEWPPHAHLWFLKAGLSSHDAGVMGAYYHRPTNRVVLPVLVGSEPVFWQARALTAGQQPKYLAPLAPAGGVVPRWGSAPSITLVEDLLSCYKVGTTSGCEAWCLMGTSLKAGVLLALLEEQRPVNVWLDPDGPGRRAAAKVSAELSAYGIKVRRVNSVKDPKLLHRPDIKEMLSEAVQDVVNQVGRTNTVELLKALSRHNLRATS